MASTSAPPTVHTLTVVPGGIAGSEPPRSVTVPSRATVGEAIAAVVDALDWDRAAPHHVLTPGLTRYGLPDRRGELGFERRTRDERTHAVTEALPAVGSTARLAHGDRVVDLVVTAIGVTDEPVDGTPASGPGGQRSRITTERAPTS